MKKKSFATEVGETVIVVDKGFEFNLRPDWKTRWWQVRFGDQRPWLLAFSEDRVDLFRRGLRLLLAKLDEKWPERPRPGYAGFEWGTPSAAMAARKKLARLTQKARKARRDRRKK
jgi:hypothetical protein